MRLFCSFLLLLGTLFAEPADWIVSARFLLTSSGPRRIIENGALAIRAERIVGVGTRPEIDRRFQAKQRLDRPDAILAPGLVNTHTHAAMSLFRGIADDLRLRDWLEKFIFPAEARNVSPDFVRWGTKLACAEMLLGGTTTYTDMYYFEDVVAEATKECGMRGVLGETIIGFPVADAKTPADSLKLAERFLTKFKGDPLITAAVAPHAIFTNSDENLKASRALANKYSAPLLIHLSETKRENDETIAKRKMSPTRALNAMGIFEGRTVAAHCVWVDSADIEIMRLKHVGVAHCPSSNAKLASGIAPIVRMRALGMAVGLGTDGVAGSNNDVDMFEEMDLAAKLQKVVSLDPQSMPASAAFEMATIGGAHVLGLDREIGSLEVGKRADIILVRIDKPHAIPLYDPISQFVYALKSSDVQDVMVNGTMVVRDGQLLTLDMKQVLAKAVEFQSKIRASLAAPPGKK